MIDMSGKGVTMLHPAMFAAAEAAVSGLDSITSSLGTSFGDIGTSLTGVITTVLPISLGIVGGVFVIKKGIAIFKGLTGH